MEKKKRKIDRMTIFNIAKTMTALAVAMLFVTVIIFLVADEPLDALYALIVGPLTSVKRFSSVIEMMIPLAFSAVAVSIIFQASQFSMIAEGSFLLGGLAAAILALVAGIPIHPVTAMIAGSIVGGLLASIPAVIKAKLGASELVVSIMLNSIALFLSQYIFNNFMRDPQASSSVSHEFQESALLPKVMSGTRLHYGLFIVMIVAVLAYLFIYKTKWGYKIRMVGLNEKFATYSGISTASVIIFSQVIGGMVAGLGGAVEILGMYKRFMWTASPGYGFDGIIIATMARNNPLMVPIASFFLAYLRVGADIMSRTTNVTNEVIALVQGIIILLISAKAFLAHRRHKIVVEQSELETLKEVN